jgi:hypothetical protein
MENLQCMKRCTHQDYRESWNNQYMHSPLIAEPSGFSEASKSPAWRDAMNKEFDALLV